MSKLQQFWVFLCVHDFMLASQVVFSFSGFSLRGPSAQSSRGSAQILETQTEEILPSSGGKCFGLFS